MKGSPDTPVAELVIPITEGGQFWEVMDAISAVTRQCAGDHAIVYANGDGKPQKRTYSVYRENSTTEHTPLVLRVRCETAAEVECVRVHLHALLGAKVEEVTGRKLPASSVRPAGTPGGAGLPDFAAGLQAGRQPA